MNKTCPDCTLPKDTSLFNKKLDGFSTYCKECTSKRKKLWKKPSVEQNKASRLRYRDRNPGHYYQLRRRWTNQYRKNHPEMYKVLDLKATLKEYGLSIEEFQEMERKQDYVCAICRKPNMIKDEEIRLCVDHNHTTGEVRGLLCNACNALLGMAKDNVETLLSSIEYLKSTTPVLQV